MTSITQLIRKDLLQFEMYRSAREEANKGTVWLNANESPFSDDQNMNRYPHKQPEQLASKLANIMGIKQQEMLITRGSDEGIDLIIRLFCSAGKDAIMITPPTYGMYAVYANLQNARVINVPLDKKNKFQLDSSSVMAGWNSSVKVIFLCSPNNPTGNLLNKNDILELCAEFNNRSMIVVDEAYIDFSEQKSLVRFINQYPNLIILRTCSKAYGLAGARLGVLVAHAELIEWFLKLIAPYPLSSLVTRYAEKILNVKTIQNNIELIKSQRNYVLDALKVSSNVETVYESEGNFLLFSSKKAAEIMKTCLDHGIVIRSMFDKPGLENHLRVTIGLPEENKKFIACLNEVVYD